MVTLKPSIPEVVPGPGHLGEFLFLMDCSLYQDAQVPSEDVITKDFPYFSCSGSGQSQAALWGQRFCLASSTELCPSFFLSPEHTALPPQEFASGLLLQHLQFWGHFQSLLFVSWG